MARINFPSNFAKLVKLFTDFKTKYDAEAGASVTQPFLDEQGIDPTADEARVTAAAAANTAFEKAEKDSEEFTEQRDDLFDPVFKDHINCVQFLKKLFRNNASKLGEWGQTIDAGDRVVYPSDFMGRTVVVKNFITKHASFPVGTSPLLPYLTETGINLTTNATNVSDAVTAHNNMLAQDALKEEKREERDNNMAPVTEHLRGIGQILVGLFSMAPHKAGQWGYIIDDSPQADRLRDVILKPGEVKTIHDAVLQSVLTVKGPQAATIFPGQTIEGTGITINSGQTFLIIRTYATFTIKNESDAQATEFTFTENR